MQAVEELKTVKSLTKRQISGKLYRIKNKTKIAAYQKGYFEANRQSHTFYVRVYHFKRRLKLLVILAGDNSPHCIWCGETDFRWIQFSRKYIDSDNDTKQRKYTNCRYSESKFYKHYLVDNPPEVARRELQILCANCNQKNVCYSRINKDSLKLYLQRLSGFKIKLKLMDVLGSYVCIKCGEGDLRCIEFDHQEGGGYKDIVTRFKRNYFGYYITHPEEARTKLQVLCANCNQRKKFDNREFGRGRSVAVVNDI